MQRTAGGYSGRKSGKCPFVDIRLINPEVGVGVGRKELAGKR